MLMQRMLMQRLNDVDYIRVGREKGEISEYERCHGARAREKTGKVQKRVRNKKEISKYLMAFVCCYFSCYFLYLLHNIYTQSISSYQVFHLFMHRHTCLHRPESFREWNGTHCVRVNESHHTANAERDRDRHRERREWTLEWVSNIISRKL